MKIFFQRSFLKQYKKLPKKIQVQFGERLELFSASQNHSLLHVHQLKGNKYPLQSLNVTGDYRALFLIRGNTVTFYEIGTHSELYE